MSDDDWQKVRRRRRTNAADRERKMGALGIPVVPLAIMSLENEVTMEDKEEAERRKKRNESKKKRKAEQKVQAQQQAEAQQQALSSAAAGATKQAAKQPPNPAAAAAAAAATNAHAALEIQRPLFLLAWLYACVEWLRRLVASITEAGGSKHKLGRKPKPTVAASAAGAAAAPTHAVEPAATMLAPAATAAAEKARGSAPMSTQSTQQQQNQQQAKGSRPPQLQGKPQQQQAQQQVVPQQQQQQQQQQQAQQQQAATVQQQAAPVKPAPVPIKADPAWAPGHFHLFEQPDSHADVVSSVALMGEYFITTGYDSDVQVWHWPQGSPPQLSRHLSGHSGRVEAVCASNVQRQALTSGRDSTLKLWDLSAGPGAARELRSFYVFESVKSLEVDWANSRAFLGCKSGCICVWDLKAGKKVTVLRGHDDEVTSLRLDPSGQLLFSGCRDGKVVAWRLASQQQQQQQPVQVAAGTAAKGRVAALAVAGSNLYVGDFSSSIKVVDISQLHSHTSSTPSARQAQLQPARRLANADVFAGDECPVAGLCPCPAAGVLVSSAVSWLDPQTPGELREADADAEQPLACLHVHTSLEQPEQYMYTLRTSCCNVITCMQLDGKGRLVLGAANGAVAALQLAKGSGAAAEGWAYQKGLPIGVEELEEEEEGSDEESEDEGEQEVE